MMQRGPQHVGLGQQRAAVLAELFQTDGDECQLGTEAAKFATVLAQRVFGGLAAGTRLSPALLQLLVADGQCGQFALQAADLGVHVRLIGLWNQTPRLVDAAGQQVRLGLSGRQSTDAGTQRIAGLARSLGFGHLRFKLSLGQRFGQTVCVGQTPCMLTSQVRLRLLGSLVLLVQGLQLVHHCTHLEAECLDFLGDGRLPKLSRGQFQLDGADLFIDAIQRGRRGAELCTDFGHIGWLFERGGRGARGAAYVRCSSCTAVDVAN